MKPVVLPPCFRVSCDLWPPLVQVLLEVEAAWPRAAAICDLRWWTATEGVIPSVDTLRRRWRWSRDRVRALLGSTRWYDRTLPRPVRATAWTTRRIRQVCNGRTPTIAKRPSSKRSR